MSCMPTASQVRITADILCGSKTFSNTTVRSFCRFSKTFLRRSSLSGVIFFSWQLAVGSWQLAVGSCQLAVVSWELGGGSWELAVGSGHLSVDSLQLAVGSWQLAVGSWQLAVGSWQKGKKVF